VNGFEVIDRKLHTRAFFHLQAEDFLNLILEGWALHLAVVEYPEKIVLRYVPEVFPFVFAEWHLHFERFLGRVDGKGSVAVWV